MRIIKPMETPEGKGCVHRKAWREAYAGLIGRDFLNSLTPEKSVEIARRRPVTELRMVRMR